MRTLRRILVTLALVAAPLGAAAQTVDARYVVDRVINRERELNKALREYTPLVETYIQNLRVDDELGKVPSSDRYFLGKADLSRGVRLQLLTRKAGSKQGFFSAFKDWLLLEYEPQGFLQMIFLDEERFDRRHYQFDYVQREFLGEVRCLVFDVRPLPRSGKGRFRGRIWVEDQDYTIVRFNGVYSGRSATAFYFHFDSWRLQAGPKLWVPAAIYSEESDVPYGVGQRLRFKSQTRLWGYGLAGARRSEQEMSSIWVESPLPIRDQSETARDYSPIEAQRAWNQQSEQNVLSRLERLGLLAPAGEVDKVLDTVVNNLVVTNNLQLGPEVRCRVLLTTTLESFTVGRTIILSRGLLDVLPDEGALATVLAHELGHVVLGHQADTQFAFFDRLLFEDKEAFRHFTFEQTTGEERAASQKAMELLSRSPYKDTLRNAALFGFALDAHAKDVPNLISPHLGSRVPAYFEQMHAAAPPPAQRAGQVAALPLGSRIKVDPWSGGVQMLKTQVASSLVEREKMPFQLTPIRLYLTRLPGTMPAEKALATSPR